MSELHLETSRLVNINIFLLFLVWIEPFLFNELIQPASLLAEYVSILYALDLGGLFAIQALLSNAVLAEKNKPETVLQTHRFRRYTLITSSALFFISALPVFWVWGIQIMGFFIPVRIILWLIPLFLPSIRRLLERKITSTCEK